MEKSLNRVAQNLSRIREAIDSAALACGREPSEIQLMAVTKTVAPEIVNEAIACGICLLGENRAQELVDKYDSYHKYGVDIHFIGHLQTNKVKYIVDKVSMIHSVDNIKLANEISRQCVAKRRHMRVLVEVNIGGEMSKSGVSPEDTEPLIRQMAALPNITVCGLMTIPPPSRENLVMEGYFSRMQSLMVDIKGKNIDNIHMDFLSMGMSDDFVHAIKYGANIIRLGSAIFGVRG